MRSREKFFSVQGIFMGIVFDIRKDLEVDPPLVSISPIGLTAKRIIDIALALSGIILLAPLLIICFALTRVSCSGPAIFRHTRVGFGGKPFECLKFRTMAVDAPERLRKLLEENPVAAAEWAACQKLRNDPRITPIGAILRKSSLDELPQLFNVLKGDMSIVGPRPVTEEELSRYGASVKVYAACRPGITGLWQVSGRSSTSYQTRVACDTYYARMWSLSLDVKIMLVTIPSVLFTDGAH
jgi:exopolysaccharide production protein ExoY